MARKHFNSLERHTLERIHDRQYKRRVRKTKRDKLEKQLKKQAETYNRIGVISKLLTAKVKV